MGTLSGSDGQSNSNSWESGAWNNWSANDWAYSNWDNCGWSNCGSGCGGWGCGSSSGGWNGSVAGNAAVQIQAYNNIDSFSATTILADGTVNILAGLDGQGNRSGDLNSMGQLVGGSILQMTVGTINGAGGSINIAAGGYINSLKANSISSGNGAVKVTAFHDMTVSVKQVSRSSGGTVSFAAGGQVIDLLHAIPGSLITQGIAPTFPTLITQV